MTTSKQDNDFLSHVISERLLEDAIDWISSNMDPEEVFSRDELEQWAIDNGMDFPG